MTRIKITPAVKLQQQLHERLGQATDDPNLMAGHLFKGIKAHANLVGDRAVIAGRGNPVGAMFPMMAPPVKKPKPKSAPGQKRP